MDNQLNAQHGVSPSTAQGGGSSGAGDAMKPPAYVFFELPTLFPMEHSPQPCNIAFFSAQPVQHPVAIRADRDEVLA